MIRENLDIGRPDHVQLIFERRITKQTPGRFRTRVITEGVTPSLHIDYKRSRIKQYHKEARACGPRRRSTIPMTSTSASGCLIFPPYGGSASSQSTSLGRPTGSARIALGEDAFHGVDDLIEVDGQRASGLALADVAVQALLGAVGVPSLASGFFQPRLARPLGCPAG